MRDAAVFGYAFLVSIRAPRVRRDTWRRYVTANIEVSIRAPRVRRDRLRHWFSLANIAVSIRAPRVRRDIVPSVSAMIFDEFQSARLA